MVRLRNMTVTHQRLIVTVPPLTPHNSTVDVVDQGVSTRDIMFKPGNDSVRVHQKFRLRVQREQSPHRRNGTHVENMKDPVQA